MFSVKEYIEIFHLIFLRHLENKLDKTLYSLKGGCNLRFFFKSIRYSEDIDFDIQIINKETLRTKINKLLTNTDFKKCIKNYQIEIHQISEAKQTETTQRWKINLKIANIATIIPTKIEFSKRINFNKEETDFIKIDPELIQKYKMYPIMINHYTLKAAFNQKINALIHRTETQARDVFDLQLLIDAGASLQDLDLELKNKIPVAIENLININFPTFKSQVVGYLLVEYQNYYNKPQIWQEIQNKIKNFLLL
jgi:predicted nucleotidyltransferase component of viral defense system